MRGTIAFERPNCRKGTFMHIKLNDAIYPISNCKSGPGQSCPLASYQALVAKKPKAAGDFEKSCNVTASVISSGSERTTFLTDVKLPFDQALISSTRGNPLGSCVYWHFVPRSVYLTSSLGFILFGILFVHYINSTYNP